MIRMLEEFPVLHYTEVLKQAEEVKSKSMGSFM